VLALSPQLAEHCGALPTRRLEVVALAASQLEELRAAWIGVQDLNDASVVQSLLCDHFRSILPHFALSSPLSRRALLALRGRPELAEGEIARDLRVHPSDVSRSVRESFGVRLVDYRVRLRLMQFIQSVDSGLSLARAAYASGFGSYTQCHRVFTKHLNCSPRDYFDRRRVEVDALLHADLVPAV
jgi:AraC-like DNA-binding protein